MAGTTNADIETTSAAAGKPRQEEAKTTGHPTTK